MHHVQLSDCDKEDRCLGIFRSKIKGSDHLEFVFDNQGYGHCFARKERMASLTKIITADDQSADSYIIEEIRSLQNPKSLQVVSSDRAIQQVAKEFRVTYWDSDTFLSIYLAREAASSDKPEFTALSEHDLAAWLRVFGEDTKDSRY